ncbi:hypothetical protein [Nostoc sp.]|uniref:hypothetical protein n=1 Tax=Nostoc sp. TaxID=1180 RepID=UPI002FF5E8E0
MNVISVTKETSFADFVCHVLNICGKKEIVVIVAAANPRTVRKSMFNYLYQVAISYISDRPSLLDATLYETFYTVERSLQQLNN